MNPIRLVEQLAQFIEPVVADFDLESNKPGIRKAPQVIVDSLGSKKPASKQETPTHPNVIVRFTESQDESAKVKILCGTYCEDEQNGWRDPMNVALRIQKALMATRSIGAFYIEKTGIELPEEQPLPHWVAILTVTVTMPQICQEGFEDVFA